LRLARSIAKICTLDMVSSFKCATLARMTSYDARRRGIHRISSENGVLTLSVGGQGPHHDMVALSGALNLAPEKIRVLNPMMGGAFGGKEDLNVQLPLALATFKTGRPSRLMYDREESIRVGVKRHGYQVAYEVGAAADGTLLTANISLLSDAGAYMTYSPVVLSQSVEHCTDPYRFKAVKVDAKAIYTNNGVASAFRGVGAPQVLPGIEQAVDDIARATGISPFEVRRRNLLRKGDKAGPGFPMAENPILAPLLDAAEAGSLWSGREAFKAAASPFAARGVGVSSVWYSFGLGSGAEAGATVRLTRRASGRYLLELGVPDVGNGNLTSFMMIAAEHLACTLEDIDYIMGDSFGPNSGATHGSRTTYVVGNAVAKTAKELRAKIAAAGHNDDLVVEASFIPEQTEQFVFGMPHIAYNYLVQVMGIEVDRLTGEVSVLEVENYVETGRMIHPQNIEGQIEGAFVQGLGFALYEDLILQAGKVMNPSLTNYVIPSIRDTPIKMTTRLFEHPDVTNPLGVRGLGEIGLPVVPCSVANSIYDAIGHRFAKFPISPEAVLSALKGEE
ncbi:molybdopterin-dependent oxidoreductase, partial [Agrobacterium sp. O3.4]